MTPRPHASAGLRDDRGSVAVLFCFIVLIVGVLVTALVDAGTAIQAANRADTYSAEAARAASIAIGPVPTGGGTDAQLAATAARSYLDQAGATDRGRRDLGDEDRARQHDHAVARRGQP